MNTISQQATARSNCYDKLYNSSIIGVSIGLLALLVLFISLLALLSAPVWQTFGIGFITSSNWNPPLNEFGALIPIIGTLITASIALLVAVPMSLCLAIFITMLAPKRTRRLYTVSLEVMAGIPSIIYGMWGLFIVVPLMATYGEPFLASFFAPIPLLNHLFSGPFLGIGLLTAGLILAIMVIPLMTSILVDLIQSVPTRLVEAAYGVGSHRYEAFRSIILPSIKKGLFSTIILGFGRAIGETMAVTFVVGNAYYFTGQLFSPGATIASSIANEFAEAASLLHRDSLLTLGLLLFALTFIILWATRLVSHKKKEVT